MNRKIFYLNITLLIIASLFAVKTFSLPGHQFIQKALAAIGSITGEGNTNFLARFVGAAPSNQIGDSTIFSEGAGAGVEYVRITSTGNVGIGITSPAHPLQVSQDGSTLALGISTDVFTAGSSGSLIRIRHGGTSGSTYGILENLVSGGVATGNLVLNPSGGNVGIGTTAPVRNLDILGGVDTYIHFTNADTGTADSDGSLIGIGTTEQLTFMNRENTDTKFFTNNTERMRITNTGNVGIGTTIPGALLDLGGNLQFYNVPGSPVRSRMAFLTDGTGWQYRIAKIQSGTITDLVTVHDNGNVGIGTGAGTPGAKLEVNGAIKLTPLAADPSDLTNGMMWMRQ